MTPADRYQTLLRLLWHCREETRLCIMAWTIGLRFLHSDELHRAAGFFETATELASGAAHYAQLYRESIE